MSTNTNTSAPAPQQVIYVAQGKSRTAYILLALFFGGMGIHDFYAGFVGKGFMKILVSSIGSLLFWGGGLGAAAAASMANEMDPAPQQMAAIPMFGLLMLGVQSLYIWIQIFTQTHDSKGIPFN